MTEAGETARESSSGPTLREALPGLIGLLVAGFLAVTTELLPVGVLPAIGEAFDVEESVAGLLVSAYAVMVAALAVPLTILTRKLPRKPLLLALMATFAVSNALVAVAPTFEVVVAGRVVGGLTHALFFSVSIGYSARLVDRIWMGRAMAVVGSGISAGLILGVPLMTSLASALGWRVAFATLAVLGLASTVGVSRILPPVGNDVPAREAGTSGGHGRLAAAVSANGLTFLGQFTLYTFISLVLLGSGADERAIGPLLLGLGLCGLAGLWFAGRTLDRNPRFGAVAVLAVTSLAIVAVGVGYPSLAAVVIAAAIWGAAFGAVPSVFQSVAVRTHSTSGEMAGAWVNATSNAGIAGGAALGALLLDRGGVDDLPWAAATITALALVVVLFARQTFSRTP